MTSIGDAPCGGCGAHIYNIRLIEESKESDGRGGHWWKTEPGQQCPDCGEPMNWYHKSPPITMELPSNMPAARESGTQA